MALYDTQGKVGHAGARPPLGPVFALTDNALSA